MSAKKILAVAVLSVFLVGGSQAVSFAGGHCGKSSSCSGAKHKMCDKFFWKLKKLMVWQDDLGLSAEQVEQLKALKWSTKRAAIEHKAQADMLKVDIKSELYKDAIDLDKVNTLIDEKYEVKKAKSKLFARGFAEMKSILGPEKLAAAKKRMRAQKAGHCAK